MNDINTKNVSKMHFLIPLLILALGILLTGCQSIPEKNAKAVANKWIEAIKIKDYEKAITYYSIKHSKEIKVFNGEEKQDIVDRLKSEGNNYGEIESYNLLRVNKYKTEVDSRKEFYILEYKVKYSKLPNARYYIIRTYAPSDEDEMKIVEYQNNES